MRSGSERRQRHTSQTKKTQSGLKKHGQRVFKSGGALLKEQTVDGQKVYSQLHATEDLAKAGGGTTVSGGISAAAISGTIATGVGADQIINTDSGTVTYAMATESLSIYGGSSTIATAAVDADNEITISTLKVPNAITDGNGIVDFTFDGSAAAAVTLGTPSTLTGVTTNAVTADSHTHAITGAALTKADDTNVTLTLGDNHATSLLNAASLTLGWAGQLSVARGGTGLATVATNSILTGNGVGALTAEANLTFDGSNLSLSGGTSAYMFSIQSDANLANIEIEQNYTDVDAPHFTFRKSRGTNTTKGGVEENDELGEIYFIGWNETSETWQQGAFIQALVDGGASGSNYDMPGRLVFATTPDGSGTPDIRMTIKNDGTVGINKTSPDSRLEILDDTSPQLRLTHTDSIDYTTFQTDSVGDLHILPSGKDIFLGGVADDIQLGHDDLNTSLFTGSGWGIQEDSGEYSLFIDNLWVRGRMWVWELILNQIRATNGSLIVSSAGKISSATLVSGSTWRLEFETGDDGSLDYHPFANGDLILAHDFTLGQSGSSPTTIQEARMEVSNADLTPTYASNFLEADLEAGYDSPWTGATFARIGSTSNEDREGGLYLTSNDADSPFMDVWDNVINWSDWNGSSKVKVRVGKLDGITSGSNEYGLWAGVSDTNYLKASGSGLVMHSTANQYTDYSGTAIDFYDNIGGAKKKLSIGSGNISIFANDGTTEIAKWDNSTITLGEGGADKPQVEVTSSAINIKYNNNTVATFADTISLGVSGGDNPQFHIDNVGKITGPGIYRRDVDGSGTKDWAIELSRLFGDGVDGDATISANTSLTSDKYYDDLTIDTDIELNTNGYRLFVRGTLTFGNSAVIHNNGEDATDGGDGGAGGAGDSGGGEAGDGGSGGGAGTLMGGVDGSNGCVGGDGATDGGSGDIGFSGSGNTTFFDPCASDQVGGAGKAGEAGAEGASGGGAGGASGSGGAGGSASLSSFPFSSTDPHLILPFRDFYGNSSYAQCIYPSCGSGSGGSGGGGGAKDTYNGGGGGGSGGSGGSGGVVLIAARIISAGTSTIISANGGDGGDGGNGGFGEVPAGGRGGVGGAGAGSAGGAVVVITSTSADDLTNLTISADGGQGGTGYGGQAGNGSAGYTALINV